MRPGWWKPNREIKEKIEKHCKKNPEFALKVQEEIRAWELKRESSKEEPTTIDKINHMGYNSEVENIGAALVAGSAKSCSSHDVGDFRF